MAFLEIDGIGKRFGGTEVLKRIDIAVEEGDFLVLVGPSGCGKSTLLNMIAGLESVTEGEIRIKGARVNEVHPSQRDIAMVFQSYALFPTCRGRLLLRHGDAQRAKAVPGNRRSGLLLQIEHLLKRRPSQLSKVCASGWP
jgi:multiple sugar transport system ATP-binding protein